MRSLVLMLVVACKGPTPTLAPITGPAGTLVPSNVDPVAVTLAADRCTDDFTLDVTVDVGWVDRDVSWELSAGAFRQTGLSRVEPDGTFSATGGGPDWPCVDGSCPSFSLGLTVDDATSTSTVEADFSGSSYGPHVVDADADGYGVGEPMAMCPTDGFAAVAVLRGPESDCDDTNALVNPGAAEVCNEADDNCNDAVDEGASGWRDPAAGTSGLVLDVSVVTGDPLEICGTTDVTGTLTTDLTLSAFGDGAILNGGITVAAGAGLVVEDMDWVVSDVASQGAGFTTAGDVTLTDVDLECLASTTYALGGAAHVMDGGSLTMTRGSVGGCLAMEGGAVYAAANSTVSLDATFLFNNSATGAGGAVRSIDALLLVDGATFDENAALVGGAIASTGGTVSVQYGGFTENTATTDGGAVHIVGAVSPVAVVGAAFDHNSADLNGGAVFVDSPASFTTTQFTNNLAGVDGAGVHASGGLTVSGSSLFRDNVALGSGGGVAVTHRDLSVSDSSFEGNVADADGAGVFATASPTSAVAPILFSNVTLLDNEAAGQGGGAYIHAAAASDVTFAAATLTNNEGSSGGALSIVANGAPVSLDATAVDNVSTVGDGGVLLLENAGAVTLSGLYDNNVAEVNGGVGSIEAESLDLAGTYSENLAVGRGAVVDATVPTLTGDGLLVNDNLALEGIIATTGDISVSHWVTRDNDPAVFLLPTTADLICTACDLPTTNAHAVQYGTTTSSPATGGVWTVTCTAGAACSYVP